ncbi:unnamed protein product [Rhizophagus irregularis]|nr:unnamed protein product [Rhizophagus irregularis]CAB5333776.1 unnamed protein product [Rhizophagus irregularis]
MNEEKVPLIEFPMKSYEYTLGNISASQDNYEYWSPPLPTAIDMYWQLNFMSRFENNTKYCVLGVYAIPNENELKDDLTWSSRRAFHIYIYIRTEEKFLRKDHTPTKLFNNSRKFITGLNTIFEKSKLPEKFIIGIEFKRSESYRFLNLSPNVNQNLIEAWTELYNIEEDSSIKFIINEVSDRSSKNKPKERQKVHQQTKIVETTINKSFLDKRSSYFDFSSIFTIEESMITLNVIFTEAFLEFIRYIYTDQICFLINVYDEDSINLTNKLFDIADDYEANELKDRIDEILPRDI